MLSQKMKTKMAKQKTVGHSAGSVIPHEMMEQWIEEVENLEASQHEPIVTLPVYAQEIRCSYKFL